MSSSGKLKSLDFYRKIPRDLTEASLSGAGLSIIAALAMMFLFGMVGSSYLLVGYILFETANVLFDPNKFIFGWELNNYLSFSSSTSVVVDKSSDEDFLRIGFNISFPALSCEFASVDVSDVLGTNRLNITKTLRKFSIDPNLKPIGPEFHSASVLGEIMHGDNEVDEYGSEGSVSLTSQTFDKVAHQFPIAVINFYAPWCSWCNRLKPSWEKTAKILRERYDPEQDGRIILAKVDCTKEGELCKRNHVQGYPSIRIFRKGSDLRGEQGHHSHESYYGDRDTDSLVKTMEALVASLPAESRGLALEDKSEKNEKRPAPNAGGCRIEGFVHVKKVPGNLIIAARSSSHSFDPTQMNMSHVITHLSFGRKINPRVMTDVQRLIPHLGGSHGRLDGRAFINDHDIGANVTIEHYLQIVKIEVMTGSCPQHKLVEEYEYTAHSSLAQSVRIPVAKFHFELSPMQVLITENSKSFSHFITNVCAIIGGVFTVAGILDSALHNTMRLMKKVELGKNF